MNPSESCGPVAITLGEPAGIGPDIVVQLLQDAFIRSHSVVVGQRALLEQRADLLGLSLPDDAVVKDIPLPAPVQAGQLDVRNAPFVLGMLDSAIAGCQAGEYSAMVTAPLQKSVIADWGLPFSGHTEYLAEKTGTAQVVMMLAGGGLRVALATTHLPLRAVADAIEARSLTRTLDILLCDLRSKFGLEKPRIMVCGLNPHAGESGHMGREEIEVIGPVIEQFKIRGEAVSGPWPADTLFQEKYLSQCDAVLAMYHDQGLPVLKHASFGQGVNITLGLPIVRTSVDHGTALDLAGTGRADSGSLRHAWQSAFEMARARVSNQGHIPRHV